MLTALQHDRVDDQEFSFIVEFFNENCPGEFEEKEFNEVLREIKSDDFFDSEASCLRIQRYADYLEYRELNLLFKFLDAFLSKYSLRTYFANQFLVYCLRLLQRTSSVYITKRNYPHLFEFKKDLEITDLTVGRLNVIRSQLSDMLRAESSKAAQIPLWEIIIILTTMHCAYCKVRDDDLSIYNILIRYARSSLKGLSFQQVMKICRNILDLTKANPGMHMLFIGHVDQYMDFKEKRDLLSNLFLLKKAVPDPSPELNHFMDSVILATRFNVDDIGRLKFKLTNDNQTLPENFKVVTVDEKGETFSFADGDLVTAIEGAAKNSLTVHCEGNDKFKLRITQNGESSTKEVGADDEFYFDSTCFLFKPESKEVCYFELSSSSLYMKNAVLKYKGNKILDDISLMAKSGEMIAVVGPSGCGKSTMLTMLSGILEYSEGDIFFDGKRVSTVEEFSEISTYIPQDDILFRELTVHESIENSVKLKVKSTEEDYSTRLKSTIQVLGLERTEFLKIGNEGEKGISGGQRKRVNIGTTIVADMKPILLFDEPTSGLDPATDLEIMQLLRELSRRGHIVLCVTHNLSDESMSYFDKLMVLGKTGQVQFFGKNKRALFFFSINTTQILFQKMKDATSMDYHDKFQACSESLNLQDEIEKVTGYYREAKSTTKSLTGDEQQLPGFISNTRNFFKREIIRKLRDPQFLMMSLIQPILIGLFISWNFVGPLPNALFSLMTAALWIGAISSVREINSEIPQLKRDYMYGTSLMGYFTSKVSSSFLFSALQTFILSNIIIYFGAYLERPYSIYYGSFLGNLLLLNLFGICLGLFLSSAIKSTLAAVGILPVILIPLIIMGGALIRHNHSEGYQWSVMKYNPLRVAYEASLFSSKTILRPQITKMEKRKESEAGKQLKLWNVYEDKLRLFKTNPQKYKELFSEGDINDIFAGYLNDVEPDTSQLKPPSEPAKVESPGLLKYQKKLWLEGYSLLPVDKPDGLGGLDFGTKAYYKHYKVRAPKAFSEDISAQGALGMYQTVGDEELSIYSPIQYYLITMIEILILCLGMYGTLRYKLSSKF